LANCRESDGVRLLENLDLDRVRLETLGVETIGQRTSSRFRVAR
jgi:hypothetical protein